MTFRVPQGDRDNQAKARFLTIQLVRLCGVGLALFGLLIIARKIDLPIEAGYGLFVVGLLDAMIAPLLLSRRWKSRGR
jgi:hypothetical protein